MKKVLILLVFGFLLGGASGCRVAECWNYAWNSRFHPERNVVASEPCIVSDPCNEPCGSVCGDACGAPAITTGPVVVQ